MVATGSGERTAAAATFDGGSARDDDGMAVAGNGDDDDDDGEDEPPDLEDRTPIENGSGTTTGEDDPSLFLGTSPGRMNLKTATFLNHTPPPPDRRRSSRGNGTCPGRAAAPPIEAAAARPVTSASPADFAVLDPSRILARRCGPRLSSFARSYYLSDDVDSEVETAPEREPAGAMVGNRVGCDSGSGASPLDDPVLGSFSAAVWKEESGDASALSYDGGDNAVDEREAEGDADDTLHDAGVSTTASNLDHTEDDEEATTAATADGTTAIFTDRGAPDSKYSRYHLQVDPDQDDTAVEIPLYSASRPHMRAFHLAWISFFVAFFTWFAMTP